MSPGGPADAVAAWVEYGALAVAAGAGLLCGAGLVSMRSTLAKLHFLGPLSVLGAPAVALAITARYHLGSMSLQAWAVAAMVMFSGPLVSHGTAKAVGTSPRRAGEGGGNE